MDRLIIYQRALPPENLLSQKRNTTYTNGSSLEPPIGISSYCTTIHYKSRRGLCRFSTTSHLPWDHHDQQFHRSVVFPAAFILVLRQTYTWCDMRLYNNENNKQGGFFLWHVGDKIFTEDLVQWKPEENEGHRRRSVRRVTVHWIHVISIDFLLSWSCFHPSVRSVLRWTSRFDY